MVTDQGRLIRLTTASCASWADMFRGEDVTDGAHLDLAKVQMFYFTIILVLAYTFALGDMFIEQMATPSLIAAFPALNTGAIALLGISHAGYLVNKAAT